MNCTQARRLPTSLFVFQGKLAKATQGEEVTTLNFADGTIQEFRKTERVSYSLDTPVGEDCHLGHGPMRVTLKSVYCTTCDRALQVAYLAKKKAGLPTTIVEARKAELAENVDRLCYLIASHTPSKSDLVRTALLGAARVSGAARYTDVARQHSLTVEQANTLTGLNMVATTWAEFRAATLEEDAA